MPIIGMLVEVTSLEETKTRIVPVLEAQGYDYTTAAKMRARRTAGSSAWTPLGMVQTTPSTSRRRTCAYPINGQAR
jgi:hypothetical protein